MAILKERTPIPTTTWHFHEAGTAFHAEDAAKGVLMMKKSPMGLFIGPYDSNFMLKWKITGKKGFRWFYARSAPIFFFCMAVIFIGGNMLIGGKHQAFGGDIVSILAASLVFAAVMPLVLWKKYEDTYRRKAEKRKNAARQKEVN
jgi:hypothetical protein